jgi:hypothetical protein
MGTRKAFRIGICMAVAAVASLSAARSASAQTTAPIRYVFGTNSYTDSKGQGWSPVPTSYLNGSGSWHWSTYAKNASFTGTPDPGLYEQQIAEDTGDMFLTVPVPSGTYTVNLYFAEPSSSYTAGMRVFGVVLNGKTIVSRLDEVATVGVEKPVIESAPVNGSEIVLDLKRISNDQTIAAIEILPQLSPFQLTAKLKWDDGSPVTGTVAVSQEISTAPAESKDLGTFPLDASGTTSGGITPDLTLPLNFSFTLINPNGAIVNTFTFSCDMPTLKMLPHAVTATVVLEKSSATLESFSF